MKNKQKIYPWLVMTATGLLCAIIADTYTSTISLFLDPLVKSMHVSLSVVSLYFTVTICAMAIAFPLVGRFIDKVNLRLALLLTVIVAAASVWILSRATNLVIFYAMAAVIGFCCGTSGYIVQGIVIDNWFDKKRNFAFTAAAFVDTIYLIIMTPITSFLIQNLGWRSALLCLALMTLVVGIPCALITHLRPEEIGLKPFGASAEKTTTTDDDEAPATKNIPTKKIIFSAAFLIVLLFFALNEFAGNVIQLFPTYATQVGFGATVGGLMPTFMNAANLVIMPLFAFTTDKFGGKKALPAWAMIGIFSLVLLIIATLTHMSSIALLGSICAAVFVTIMGPGEQIFSRDMFGSAFDIGYSHVSTITNLISGFAVPVLSKVYEMTNSFNAVFAFCILLYAIVIMLIFIGSKHRFDDVHK